MLQAEILVTLQLLCPFALNSFLEFPHLSLGAAVPGFPFPPGPLDIGILPQAEFLSVTLVPSVSQHPPGRATASLCLGLWLSYTHLGP